MPWTMAAFVVGGLSLIGIPLTAGFISKWYLILAALKADLWWLAVLIVASSLLAVVYVWRVVEFAYFREPSADAAGLAQGEAPITLLPLGATRAMKRRPGEPSTTSSSAAGARSSPPRSASERARCPPALIEVSAGIWKRDSSAPIVLLLVIQKPERSTAWSLRLKSSIQRVPAVQRRASLITIVSEPVDGSFAAPGVPPGAELMLQLSGSSGSL